MANMKAKKSSPPAASHAPDPSAVRAVSADLTARFDAGSAPPGVVGATVGGPAALTASLGKGGLKKLADALVPALIKGYMIANDGKVTPEEFRQIADMGYELILQLMAMRTKGDDTPTTAPAA